MRKTSARKVDTYVASVRDRLRSTLREVQAQSTAEACRQQRYYDRKVGHCEFEAWRPGISEGGCLEGKEED